MTLIQDALNGKFNSFKEEYNKILMDKLRNHPTIKEYVETINHYSDLSKQFQDIVSKEKKYQ